MPRYMLALAAGFSLVIVASVAVMARQADQTTTSANAILAPSSLLGTVTDSAGKPLNGIPVSARATDKTYTTSVYTDENGEYVFPNLPRGEYKVWAQAVGYAIVRMDLMLDGTHASV